MNSVEPRPSRRKRVATRVLGAVLLSVILATSDMWTGLKYRRTFFSTNSWKMKDGGSTGHTGFLYSLVFWRRMDGSAYGPEVWFWFTPFVIDAAHRGVQIHWIWSQGDS